MSPESVSHYRVLDKLGEGGTAVVYRAEDVALGREVALKFLSADYSADYGRIARFQHEARTIASLNHPNICTIYEIGEHDGRHFIAMEMLDGAALSRAVSGRPIDSDRVIELAIEIADALAAAHAEGIVHRDLKPANIFVTKLDRVKLLDFGLAVVVPLHTTGHPTTVIPPSGLTGGTVPYMSPEQVQGEALDARTDLFSLGVVVYELLTSRRPFIGMTAADVKDAILHESPVPTRDLNPSIPIELVRIVDKSLEKNRKLRYQTASDLRADLQRLKRDLDSASSVTPATARAKRGAIQSPIRSSRARIAAMVAGIVIAAGLPFALKNRSVSVPVNEPSAARSPGADIVLTAEPIVTASPARPSSNKEPSSSSSFKAPVAPPAVKKRVTNGIDTPDPAATTDLRIARQKIDLKLYDQALETLRRITGGDADQRHAVDAYFLIASIHDARGRIEDAMSTYLEIASRYPEDARAPEARYEMAESMLKSKRPDHDAEARRMLTEVVQRYHSSPWAPRALMARAELETRHDLHQRDEVLSGSVPAALVTYREVMQQYHAAPAAALATWRLADAYMSLKRFDLAAATYEALADDDERRDEACFAAGELYEKRLKDPARATMAYGRVRSTSSRYAEAQKRLQKLRG
jgi:serine/threonine protein kinase/outer membrane protein assembly factor BamD (BamD/ComL family)